MKLTGFFLIGPRGLGLERPEEETILLYERPGMSEYGKREPQRFSLSVDIPSELQRTETEI